MTTHHALITELVQMNHENCLRLNGRNLPNPSPGQFLRAFAVGGAEFLPTLLYPCGGESGHGLFCGDFPKGWLPGSEIHLRGPRGNGFHLPPLAKKVALTTFDTLGVNRLLPLAGQAIANGASVTLLTNRSPENLASEIELLAMEEMNQIVDWADYLAAVFPADGMDHLIQQINPGSTRKIPAVEIMLDTPMICDENSACGVCGVQTARGWKLACKDGPVFRLDELV